MKIQVKKPYGGLNPGNQYTVISECKDGVNISYKGKPLWVPNYIFQGQLDRKYENREEEEDYGQEIEWR